MFLQLLAEYFDDSGSHFTRVGEGVFCAAGKGDDLTGGDIHGTLAFDRQADTSGNERE